MTHTDNKTMFGQYRVLQREDGSPWTLGAGAMGVTYKAVDTNLECQVALKVINPARVADENEARRFLREARAMAGLRHGNIASVYHLANENGQWFYTMELIEGETVEAFVRRSGPMLMSAALRVASQVATALAAAARQQLVHRDVKPANIMIEADRDEDDWPFIKLIDFGLVRTSSPHRDPCSMTLSGFAGTAQYASPEQIEEGELDTRADIYSLGCTLWYMLTGEAPFCGSVARVFTQQLHSEPPWEKLKGLPKSVRHLLAHMLRKNPCQRPSNALKLREEIDRCLEEALRIESLKDKTARAAQTRSEWLTAFLHPRAALICSAALFLLLLALGYWNSHRPSAVPGSPVTASAVPPAHESFAIEEKPAAKPVSWLDLPVRPPSSASLRSSRPISLAELPMSTGGIEWLAEPGAFREESFGLADDLFAQEIRLDDALALGASDGDHLESKTPSPKPKAAAKKPSPVAENPEREFEPLEEIDRARKSIRRTIRRIF